MWHQQLGTNLLGLIICVDLNFLMVLIPAFFFCDLKSFASLAKDILVELVRYVY